MRNRLAVAVTATFLIGAAAIPAASSGQESWSFTGCTGPAGTPTSFAATHAASNGAAWLLEDGTSRFVVLIFRDLTAGKEFSPPGHQSAGNVEATCTVVNPFTGHTLELSGFFTPSG